MNRPLPGTVFVVPSFHYDVAYLKTHREYMPQCFRILDEALRLLGRHPEYRFLIEQVILLEAYWTERPDQRAALVRFAREGRLEVGPGLYVMPDMNHCDGESLYQQARLGREWLETNLGLRPEVCWIADCWGHHAQLPQILAQCGYQYYCFWRCMRRDVLRTRFLWEGLDGTRLRTHWLSKGYGNILFPTAEAIENALDLDLAGCGPRDVRRLCDGLQEYGELPAVMLCNGGDFMMPQATAPDVVRRLNAAGGLPALTFGRPVDFLGSLDWAAAPVVAGEFNSALQGTFTSHIRIKQRNRELVRRLLALEALGVAAGTAPQEYPDAWKLLLKQQFHDIICGTITDAAVTDSLAEFDEAETRIRAAVEAQAPADGVPAVFNSLGRARTEIVDLGTRRAMVTLPALGFAAAEAAAVLPEPVPVPLPCTFESPGYTVRLDAQGYVTSLVERGRGVELVRREPAPFGSLGLQMDYGDFWLNFEAPLSGGSLESSLTQNVPDPFDRSKPGEIVNRATFRPQILSARAEARGGQELTVEQRGLLSFWAVQVPFTTRLTLSRVTPRLEYETQIEPSGRHYRVRAAFPTTLAGGRILHEVPFGIQERGPHEHVAQHWAAYAGAEAGLAVLNVGTPANTADEGTLLLTLFRSVAMEYKARSVLGFQEGVPHVFRYAAVPFAAGAEAEVVHQGLAFNQPPLPCRAPLERCGAGDWHLEGDANVVLSAVRWSGGDVFVRIYECAGSAGRARLCPPARLATWAPANGLQQPAGPFTACAEGIALSLRPFEVRGLLLRPCPPGR